MKSRVFHIFHLRGERASGSGGRKRNDGSADVVCKCYLNGFFFCSICQLPEQELRMHQLMSPTCFGLYYL